MTSLPLGPATRNMFDAPLGGDVRQQFLSDPFENVDTTPSGRLTFNEPSFGFFPSLRARLTESARITDELGSGFGKGLLKSGADWISGYLADQALEDVQMPGSFTSNGPDGWNVLLNGKEVPASDVTIQELWDSFSNLRKRMMLQAGFSPESLRGIRINNAQQFAEQWPKLNEAILGRQWLQRTQEEAPIRNFLAATTELVVQLGTDPFLLLSLGASSVIKSSVKKSLVKMAATGSIEDAVKALEKITGRSYAKQIAEVVAEGPTQLAARQAVSQGRTGTARALFQGGTTAYGASAASAMAYAAHTYNLQTGAIDPREDLDVPWLQAGKGGLLGFGLSEVGLRMMKKSHGQITHRKYMEDSSVLNLASEITARLYDRKPKTMDQMINMEHFKAAEAIEDYVGVMYTPRQVRELKEISNLIENTKIEDSQTALTLRDYLLTMPSHEELKWFLSIAEGDSISPLQRALDSGELPETAFAKARRELWELEPKLREALANGHTQTAKAIRRRLVAAQNAYIDSLSKLRINSVGLDETPTGLVDALRSVANDIPISTLPTHDLRVAAIQQVLNEPVVMENYHTTGLIPWFQNSWIGRISAYLSPAMRMKRGMGSENPKEVLISRMISLIDNRALGPHEILRQADGRAVEDVLNKVIDWYMQHMAPLQQAVYAASHGRSDDAVRADFKNIIRAVGGQEDAAPHNANIVNMIKNSRDEMGRRGVQSKTLDNRLDNFVPIYTVDNLTDEMIDIMIQSWYEIAIQKFGKNVGPTAKVHYNTLARLGYLKKSGSVHVFAEDIPPGFSKRIDPDTGEMLMPRTVSDLGDEFVDDYYKALEGSIRMEAEWVINRRTRKGIDYNPDAEDQLETPWVGETQNAKAVNNFVRSDMSRRIEQEVLLDERVLDSGAIDTDPLHYMEWYGRSTGYNIMRDEAVGEFFGQPVKWSELFDALKREAGNDPKAQEALKVLDHIDKSNAGRLGTSPEGAVPAYILGAFAASVATFGLTPTIIGTEGSVTTARALTSSQYYPTLIENIKNALRHVVDSGYAGSLGMETAMDQYTSRIMTDHGDHLSKNVRNNKAVQVMQVVSSGSRVVSFERQTTNFFKQVNYDVTYGSLWPLRKRLLKLADMDLQKVVEDAKTDRGIARSAGIEYGKYRLLKQYGLLDPEMLRMAARINELDSKALSSRGRLKSVIMKMSDDEQKIARELDRRLARFALDDAQKFIATPSASTRASASGALGNNPWIRLLSSFTSWVITFQAATMSRLATAAYNKQAGFLALYLAGEIWSQMYRDVVYGGYSPDEAAAKWTENPAKQTAIVLSRLPVWGAFNPWMGAIQAMSAGYGTGAASAFDSPALGIFQRAVDSTYGIGKAIVNGETPSDGDIRNMKRIMPVMNLWWIRGTERVLEGLESER